MALSCTQRPKNERKLAIVFHQNGLSPVSARLIAPGSRLVGFGPRRLSYTKRNQCQALQEPKKALLAQVLRTLGQERCQALFTAACTIEASGGMLTSAGERRRTPGGTFFHLVRQQCSRQERARLFPYPSAKQSPQHPQQLRPDAAPVPLTIDQWKGLTPMPVTATLKLVLRDLPETRESNDLVYMALQNEPRGLPKGISLDSGPLYLSSPVKQWRTACTRAEQIRATGTPALLIVEAHVSTKEGALIGVVKSVQVVEGKASVPPQATAPSA